MPSTTSVISAPIPSKDPSSIQRRKALAHVESVGLGSGCCDVSQFDPLCVSDPETAYATQTDQVASDGEYASLTGCTVLCGWVEGDELVFVIADRALSVDTLARHIAVYDLFNGAIVYIFKFASISDLKGQVDDCEGNMKTFNERGSKICLKCP